MVTVLVVAVFALAFFLYKPLTSNIKLGLDLSGGLRVVLQAQEKEGQVINEDTINKSLGILRERVDSLGVKETLVYPQGNNRVVIEIAGESDPEAAVDMLKNTAQLEFWDEDGNVVVTGEHLKNANARIDNQNQQAEVVIEFDAEGTELFSQGTAANIGRMIMIVLDDRVISSPVVREQIHQGTATISGGFADAKEAQELAVLLRSGALPVSFTVVEKRSVGPTLGTDSLEKSVKAGIVGMIAILIFMLGYYLLPGAIADISLVLYSVVVLGCMFLLGSVLTLPGIAGFVLSVGMAVDANIIIYERIKEELRNGKTLRAGIEAGFKRAFWTIFDANTTTLLTAFVLMYFGTGPVKGFAVTLSIGIVTSLVIAVTFTRFMLVRCSYLVKNTKLYGV